MATTADGTIIPDSDVPYYNSISATVVAKRAQVSIYTARIIETQNIIDQLNEEITAGLNLMAIMADLSTSSS